MKKIIALLLALCLLLGATLTLFSCDDYYEYEPEDKEPTPETPGSDSGDKAPTIAVPEYKDYGRGSVDFDKIVYKRPNVSEITESFEAIAAAVEGGTGSFEEQLALIKATEDAYNELLTMRALANIMNSRDSSDSFYSEE
ncbi:MAG: hypothetical protein IIX96_01145, partial [Clostridia bacterium]|nr:hypothetical protein [Clostridia bacterium]